MRYSKYAPDLKTISETDLMAASVGLRPISVEVEREISMRKRDKSPTSPEESSPTAGTSSPTKPNRDHSPRSRLPVKKVRGNSRIRGLSTPTKPVTKATIAPLPTEAENPEPVLDGKYGRTILHNATRKGDLDKMRIILHKHPELLKYPDSRGNHPLHYAANPSNPQCARAVYILLKAGAYVNATNDRHQTPLLLHIISTEDDNDLVSRMLLHHHARPHIKVTEDCMIAEYAASRGHFKIAAALREYM